MSQVSAKHAFSRATFTVTFELVSHHFGNVEPWPRPADLLKKFVEAEVLGSSVFEDEPLACVSIGVSVPETDPKEKPRSPKDPKRAGGAK